MKPPRRSDAPAALLIVLACAGGAWAQQPAQPANAPTPAASAPEAPAPLPLRASLVEPLRQAQQLLKDGQFAQALGLLNGTDTIPDKTPAETYTVERMRAAAASALGNPEQAAKSLQAALSSGQTPAPEQAPLIEALAGTLFNLKQYPAAAQWARRYLEQAAGASQQQMAMRWLLAQSLYFGGDAASAAQELEALLRAQQAAGVRPSQPQLDLWAAAYITLKDDAGYMTVLEQLLANYPRKEYWTDLLIRLERKPGFDARLGLDLYRLQFAAGAMSDPADYLELAQMALQAGFPAEAQSVLAAGFAAGLLGKGPEAEKQQRYRQQVAERVEIEMKALDARAASAKDSEEVFSAGYSFATQGQVGTGLNLMQKALGQGGLKQPNDARLRLATMLARAGDKPAARALFAQVQDARTTDGASDLARLWGLLLRQ